MKKISLTKNPAPANRIGSVFLSGDSESLLLFLFQGTEFRVDFSSAEWLGREFREFASILVPWHRIPSSERNSESFLFRGTAGIPPEQTNCSVYSVFRGVIF